MIILNGGKDTGYSNTTLLLLQTPSVSIENDNHQAFFRKILKLKEIFCLFEIFLYHIKTFVIDL
jgi:hypothetical protein